MGLSGNLPANTGDMCSIPGLGRSPGEGNRDPLHGQRSLEGYSPWGHKIFRHNLVTKHHQEPIQKSLVLLWRKRGFPGWVSPSHMSPLSLDVRDQRHLCKPESNSIQETSPAAFEDGWTLVVRI